jgi:hypothetical protein
LTIRLIGLRVTKLKDLRASSPATGGIKRVSSILYAQFKASRDKNVFHGGV